jgi:DNA-binding MarR family transcriptional regulator
MAAWRAFLAAHRRVVDVLASDLEEAHGLPLTWYDVLVNLEQAREGRLRMSDLAERVMLSASGLTRLVDRMTTAGLVERLPCPDDRRVTHVTVTDAGRARLRETAPRHLDGVAQHFARHLDDAEARLVASALARVSDALDPRLCPGGSTAGPAPEDPGPATEGSRPADGSAGRG